ncbi:hypothetical protein ACEZDB_37645 [Streptacidiphilus sp. N1-3]|uniref:Nucleoside phosphorylase domain-containing protein n=1 Tax=Streptacidiphilus alkalitolerans TaxID=3342712 RepID=A0ABV6XDV1_9ACTN
MVVAHRLAVVLTALPLESEAVRRHLTDLRTLVHPTGTRFDEGRLRGTAWRVAVAEIGAGNGAAAVITERAFTWLEPEALFFVGVAGGLKDDVALGDVVVGTRIYAYHGGKLEHGRFEFRPRAWDASHRLEQAARMALRGQEWADRIPEASGSAGGSGGAPHVHFAPIAAGDVLLNDPRSTLAQQLKHGYNDAVAIEMESAGVAQAAHLTGRLQALTIRGISDKADGRKHAADAGGSQPRAAAHAAAAVFAVLDQLAQDRSAPDRRGAPRTSTGMSTGPRRSLDDDELARLRLLSENAMEDAGLVLPPGSLHPAGIGLDRLYVRRNIESVLIERLKDPTTHMVVGEPGYGKTSLLWNLHRSLTEAGWEPFLVKATALLAGLSADSSERSERADSIDLETLELAVNACLDRGSVPVLLVDTLDLLMHSPGTRRTVSDLLRLAQRRSIRMVVTCRPGEAALLDPGEDDEAGLRLIRLGLYDDAEREAAVANYADSFYSDASNRPLTSSDLQDVQKYVFNAVYHDLPLREICDNPLTLRLLFELYAPERPDQQVDVASLYDLFWERRVRRDARGGEDGSHHAPGADHGMDLRESARTLARFMLGSGTPEVSLSRASSELTRLTRGELEEVSQQLEILVRRGVLAVSTVSGTVRFFHQTFFEYAAAQHIVAAGLAGELVQRVCAEPGDLLLAAVAAQALPRLESRAECEQLLARLLEDRGQSAITLGLSIYAHRPGAGGPAQQALRTAPSDSVRRFLLLLPGIRHDDSGRWVEDLRVVWERTGETDRDLRIQLLETLRRLAGRDPEAAVEFLAEYACLSWFRGQKAQLLRSHGGLYLRLLGPVYGADPAWARGELAALWDLFLESRNAQGAADILALLREQLDLLGDTRVAAERNRVLEEFGPRLCALADGLGMSPSAPAIRAYGLLWSAGRPTASPDETLACAVALVSGARPPEEPPPGGRGADTRSAGTGPGALTRAYLHGYGELVRALSDEQSRILIAAIGEIRSPGLQAAVVDGIVVPLLAGAADGGAMVRQLVLACRAALSELPESERRADRSRRLSAVFIDAATRSGRSGSDLLELLPEGDPDIWLRSDGLARLTAAATASEHLVASQALDRWCREPDLRRQRPSRALQTTLMTSLLDFVAGQPRLMAYLIDDALLSKDPQTLAGALDLTGPPARSCVDDHRDSLQGLLIDLTGARSGEARRSGYRLWRALIKNVGWQPPDPDRLLVLLEGRPGTPDHISVLQLCSESVGSGLWTTDEAAQLLPVLRDVVHTSRSVRQRVGRREAAQGADARLLDAGADALHLMMAVHCRTGAIDTPAHRQETIEASLDLAVPADYCLDEPDGRGRFTRNIRQLGWLVERLLDVDSEAASTLLLDISAVLHGVDPGITRVQREIANRWRRPLGLVFTALGSQARKKLMLGLLEGDVALARIAIEVFAQQVSPPTWFRGLLTNHDLNPKLLDTIRGNLFFHTRSHGSDAWKELIR